MTTSMDIQRTCEMGSWRHLANAAKLVIEANGADGAGAPLLGGGTRLMLALNHRISRDVDLVFEGADPLDLLSPRNNTQAAHIAQAFAEDIGAVVLKTAGGAITFHAPDRGVRVLDDPEPSLPFALQPVGAVLARLLVQNGPLLSAEDLFDWWSVQQKMPEAIGPALLGELLTPIQDDLERALDRLEAAPKSQAKWDAIEAPDKPDFSKTLAWARIQRLEYDHAAASLYAASMDSGM